MSIEVYINHNSYAYKGVYSKVGTLPRMSEIDQQWTIIGAALFELIEHQHQKNIVIYHDTACVEDWNSAKKHRIADLIRDFVQKHGAKVRMEKVDSLSLKNYIESKKIAI